MPPQVCCIQPLPGVPRARAGKVGHRHCGGSRVLESGGGVGEGRAVVPLDKVGVDLDLERLRLSRLIRADIVELLGSLCQGRPHHSFTTCR